MKPASYNIPFKTSHKKNNSTAAISTLRKIVNDYTS